MSSIFDWSLTAANNANADSSINWQEGQDPSTVNNSARAMMTRVAQLLKDIGGTVAAGGTANVITVTSNSPITSYATGQIVGFKASATNSGAATLNVNGIGAKAIRSNTPAFDTALVGGEIADDGVYICIYDAALNATAGGWLLFNPNVDISDKADAVQATVDVASAATTNIGAAASWNVRITGTTTITAFDTASEGTLRFVRMAGALTLTHNATSLILPGAANITTVANDCFLARSLGSGNWIVMLYEKAAGTPPLPTTAAGVGNFDAFSGVAGGQWQLPATGTYAYWGTRYNAAGAFQAYISSVAAGGTIVGAGTGTDIWRGTFWRIS